MEIRNTTREALEQSLAAISERYGGNVIWDREPDYIRRSRQGGEVFKLTLRTRDSHGPGSRLTVNPFGKPKHIPKACWHVHGEFFDEVLKWTPDAVIIAGDQKITKDGGNWQDRNIGSQIAPVNYSEACECN